MGVIERLVAVHPTLNVKQGPGWAFRRCRTYADGEMPLHVDDVIWRKDVSAKLGRANPAGYQVLYVADRRDTALVETHVTHAVASVAEFCIQPGKSVRVVPIGEMTQIIRTGRGFLSGDASKTISDCLNACPPAEARSLLITDAFLLHCLVGHDDYDVSSHVAHSIFTKLPAVGAIAYPSRRQQGAINYAVRVDGFWDTWALRSVRYGTATHLAMGYYSMPVDIAVDGVFPDGRLHWQQLHGVEGTLALDPPYVGSPHDLHETTP